MGEFGTAFAVSLQSVWNDSGFSSITSGNIIMILVGCILLYMAFAKEYEPLLLSPIAFGCILANFPKTGFNDEMNVMMAIGFGIKYEIFPPIIFMGVGAMTDFGPMIADPDTMLLGAAAQFGVFIALAGAMMLGFNVQEAACIGIIGGADGPTSIYLTVKMAPHLLGAIAVAAYSYMSLVPLIQPPVMMLMTTKEQRAIRMPQLRPVTKFERIIFPVLSTIVISLLLPPVASLIGMLMLGNLFLVFFGEVRRVSDIPQILEVYSFDDLSILDVQTRYDTLCQHHFTLTLSLVLSSESRFTIAPFRARPSDLNPASSMWCSSNPLITMMCSVIPADIAKLLKKWWNRGSGQSTSA